MSKDVNLSRETAIGVGAQIVTAFLGIISLTIIARLGGVETVGLYYLGFTISYIGSRATTGVGDAIQKRVSECGEEPHEYFTFSLLTHAVISIAILGTILGAATSGYFHWLSYNLAFAIIVQTVALGFFSLILNTASGLGDPGRAVWFEVGRSFLRVIIHTPLLLLGYGPVALLVGSATGTVSIALMMTGLYRIKFHLPSMETMHQVYSFSRWSVPNALVSNIYEKYDLLILGALSTTTAVGFYETAYRVALPTRFISSSLSRALNVKSSYQSSTGKPPIDSLHQSTRVAGIIAIPMLIGAITVGDALLVGVFGEDYAAIDALIALVGVLTIQCVFVYTLPFRGFFSGIDRPDIVFKAQFSGLLVNIPLSAVLVMEYGIIGVIIGSFVVEVLVLIIYQMMLYRYFNTVIWSSDVVRQLCVGVLMGGIVYIIRGWMNPLSFVDLIGLISIGGAVYVSVLFGVSPGMRDVANHVRMSFQ